MSTIVITIQSDESQDLNKQLMQVNSSKPRRSILETAKRVSDLANGHHQGVITIQTGSADPVAASGTITCASVSNADTVTIGKTTLTFSSTPANEDQVESDGGTNTLDAEALVAAINAHSVLSKLVVASNVAGVVTVTSLVKGEIGNYIALASSNGTRLAVSAAYLASGAGGALESGLVIDRS